MFVLVVEAFAAAIEGVVEAFEAVESFRDGLDIFDGFDAEVAGKGVWELSEC